MFSFEISTMSFPGTLFNNKERCISRKRREMQQMYLAYCTLSVPTQTQGQTIPSAAFSLSWQGVHSLGVCKDTESNRDMLNIY